MAKQISRTNLKDRLCMDLALCFGDKTARTFSDLVELVPGIIEMEGGLEYHGLDSLVYSTEGFIERESPDWQPQRLEPKFDRILTSAFIAYMLSTDHTDVGSNRMWI